MNASFDTHMATLQLVDRLGWGGTLPVATTRWRLNDNEVAHHEAWVDCWWYGALDVPYEERFLAVGGPILFTATALASVAGNRRRRAAAERHAAPQWRYGGAGTALLTNQRTLIILDDQSLSLAHDALLRTDFDAAQGSLTLRPEGGVPYGRPG